MLAAALPPLLVAAHRVAATVSQGVHGRRRVGQGETFWQFRRYQPGDSTQLIDWRESAKSQHVYVRETEWEAAQSVWLWRDASPSMGYASARDLPTKRYRAELLTLALASLLVRGGEHVALLGGGAVPRAGRAALDRMVRAIEEERPSDDSLPPVEILPRFGRVVLFGDFLARLDEIRAMVEGFARQGVRGHLLQVLDPAEETLPFRGRVRFEGTEADGDVLIGRVEEVRDDYHAAVAAHVEGLAGLARATDWTFATHRTDHPPETPLLALFVALSEDPDRRD
jgi:uncharacterized protein (DUF58 family)